MGILFNSGSRDNDPEYIFWAKAVKKRDNYTCQICKKRGVPIHSHHLNSWQDFPELRYELSNGVCICCEDHDLFHSMYGLSQNTEIQFTEFKIIVQTLKKIARNNLEENKKK